MNLHFNMHVGYTMSYGFYRIKMTGILNFIVHFVSVVMQMRLIQIASQQKEKYSIIAFSFE